MEQSPYTPGAGHRPEIIAGRDVYLAEWREMLSELIVDGRKRSRDIVLTGPRGIGKTVTVVEFQVIAREFGLDVISLQSVAGTGSLIRGLMSRAEQRIRANDSAWGRAKDILGRVGGVTLGAAGMAAGVTMHPSEAPGWLPDAGLFAEGLTVLASEIAADAGPGRGGVLITVDELQVTDGPDLALLAAMLGRLNTDYPQARVAFAATGLPNTEDKLLDAEVTHPDRLFDIKDVPLQLDEDAARYAIAEPARLHGVLWDSVALDELVSAANRYPAHLQLLADQVWRSAPGPGRITENDADGGIRSGIEEIDRRTLAPRWDRISDRPAELMAAIAARGGIATSRDLAKSLDRPQSEWSKTRAELISSGDIYSPRRGELAFTVPAMTEYVLKNYPDRQSVSSIDLIPLAELIPAN